MDDSRIGAAIRAVRVRRRWRQSDVATRAGVARSVVSTIERGQLDLTTLRTIRRVAQALDIRIDLVARWRGGELDRLLSARHSALHESVARSFAGLPDWMTAPEVSFSIFGERGVIDILAFHPPTGCLLVIELKSDIVDVNELIGTIDRKSRLAARIARERGWRVTSVSRWVIVSRDKTNQRRIDAHRAMLRAAFPADGHAMRQWLRDPGTPVSGLSMWTNAGSRDPSLTRSHRVRVASTPPARIRGTAA
jgi:transcriptional regulator with XRE-family HTH domain